MALGAVIDLAKPTVVSALEVEPGDYVYAVLYMSMTGTNNKGIIPSRISFPIPEGFNYETHAFNIEYKGKVRGDDNYVSPLPSVNHGNISIEGNIITGDLTVFEPYSIDGYAVLHGKEDGAFLGTDGMLGTISNVYMGGNTYKVFNALPSTPVIKLSTYLPGFSGRLDRELNHPNELNFIIPFSGITVPEDAGAVRFEIYWNIDDIIERYEGLTASPDDDIFILKNGFWEDFSIKAFIE